MDFVLPWVNIAMALVLLGIIYVDDIMDAIINLISTKPDGKLRPDANETERVKR